MRSLSFRQNQLLSNVQMIIPIWVQHSFRDLGGVRLLLDLSVILYAIFRTIQRPAILFSHIQISRTIQLLPYGKLSDHYLQLMSFSESPSFSDSSTIEPERVLVFVHGGAWGSGQPWMYRKIVHNLAKEMEASHAVIVGYPLFPNVLMVDQVNSVIEAIQEIHSLESLNRNNNRKIILVGHSSGAHISALATASIASRANDSLSNSPLVHAFIGISGVYDIHEHYSWESSRGVHEISPMKAAATSFEKLADFSPTILLRNESSNGSISDYRVTFPPSLLVHGVDDVTVSVTQSEDFADALRPLSPVVQTCYPECGHLDPMTNFVEDSATTDAAREINRAIRNFCDQVLMLNAATVL